MPNHPGSGTPDGHFTSWGWVVKHSTNKHCTCQIVRGIRSQQCADQLSLAQRHLFLVYVSRRFNLDCPEFSVSGLGYKVDALI